MADLSTSGITWAAQNVAAPSVPAVEYCNAAWIYFSPWDFGFQFSATTVAPPTASAEGENMPEVSVSQRVVSRLTMSPPHAKAFLAALQENVAKYEAQHGEIPRIAIERAEQVSGQSAVAGGGAAAESAGSDRSEGGPAND